MPQRTVLPWSRPLLPAAVEHLCADWAGGMLDLSSRVVIMSGGAVAHDTAHEEGEWLVRREQSVSVYLRMNR